MKTEIKDLLSQELLEKFTQDILELMQGYEDKGVNQGYLVSIGLSFLTGIVLSSVNDPVAAIKMIDMSIELGISTFEKMKKKT